jgi:hypothetical protein
MVFAYFDPGTGSVLLQALVGGSAGLVVFGKFLWDSALTRVRRPRENEVSAECGMVTSESSGEIPQTLLP